MKYFLGKSFSLALGIGSARRRESARRKTRKHGTGRRFGRGFEMLEERTVLSAAPFLVSDLADYAPGATAYLTAGGYDVGETVRFHITSEAAGPGQDPWEVTDGSAEDLDVLLNGIVVTSWLCDPAGAYIDATLLATATGLTSGAMASTSFTDHPANTTTTIILASNSVTEGTAVNVTGKVVLSSSTGHGTPGAAVTTGTVQIQQSFDGGSTFTTTLASGTPNASGEFSTSFDTTGLGGTTAVFRAHYVTPGGAHTPGTSSSGSASLTINAATVTPSVTLSAADATYTGSAYDEANLSTTVVDGANNDVSSFGTISYVYYSDSGGANQIAVPTNAGTYYVKAVFTSNDAGYTNAESAIVQFEIARADAVIDIANYSGTYDGQAHGLGGTATGVNGENLTGLLDLGATYTNAGSYSVGWSFAGNENYNEASGTGTVDISAVVLDQFASASTQAALNISKAGTVSFAIGLDPSGIVDGQSIADLFNGATFTLKMKNGLGGYESIEVSAVAKVIDNVIYVDLRMDQALFSFLQQGLDGGESSASRANMECITLSASSNDGNYALNADASTRMFQSGKTSFA